MYKADNRLDYFKHEFLVAYWGNKYYQDIIENADNELQDFEYHEFCECVDQTRGYEDSHIKRNQKKH
jgi:hypothetical protein